MRRAALRRTGWAAVALTVFLVISPFPAGPAPATGRTTLILPDAGRKTFFHPPVGRAGVRGGRQPPQPGALRHLGARAGPAAEKSGRTGLGGTLPPGPHGDNAPDGNHAPRSNHSPRSNHAPRSGPGKENPTLRTTRTRKARLSLMKWDGGHLAFKLEHGRAQWLMFMSAGRRIRPGRLPKGKFDLVRLTERLLRNKVVLSWLERIRPFAVIASPQSSRRLPVEKWRILRARQRALGVYRSRYAGMSVFRPPGPLSGPAGPLPEPAGESSATAPLGPGRVSPEAAGCAIIRVRRG